MQGFRVLGVRVVFLMQGFRFFGEGARAWGCCLRLVVGRFC